VFRAEAATERTHDLAVVTKSLMSKVFERATVLQDAHAQFLEQRAWLNGTAWREPLYWLRHGRTF
jgi:hypothetical protein